MNSAELTPSPQDEPQRTLEQTIVADLAQQLSGQSLQALELECPHALRWAEVKVKRCLDYHCGTSKKTRQQVVDSWAKAQHPKTGKAWPGNPLEELVLVQLVLASHEAATELLVQRYWRAGLKYANQLGVADELTASGTGFVAPKKKKTEQRQGEQKPRRTQDSEPESTASAETVVTGPIAFAVSSALCYRRFRLYCLYLKSSGPLNGQTFAQFCRQPDWTFHPGDVFRDPHTGESIRAAEEARLQECEARVKESRQPDDTVRWAEFTDRSKQLQLDSFNGESPLIAWLGGALKTCFLGLLRSDRDQRQRQVADNAEHAAEVPAKSSTQGCEKLLTKHLEQVLMTVVPPLTAQDMELLRLLYVDGLSQSQAAKVLGVHEGRISHRKAGILRRIMESAKRHLDAVDDPAVEGCLQQIPLLGLLAAVLKKLELDGEIDAGP